MVSLVLGAVGSAIGGGFGGTILGLSGAAIGGMIGSSVGAVADAWIVGSLTPNQRVEGARLESLRVTSATEGANIPRIFGRMKIGGNIIWATDFTESFRTQTQGGGKGGGGGVTTTTALYAASFAIGLCEGPIYGIGRIWADGKAMDMTGVVMRQYFGSETQGVDPLILSKMGTNAAPAYRGTAYIMFENLALESYGNRLPQLTFEIFAPVAGAGSMEGLVQGVTMIPASGEFAYATSVVRTTVGTATKTENCNAIADRADFLVSLDRLEALAVNVRSISLVASWFGDDLRAGVCTMRPKVDAAVKNSNPAWQVDGLIRSGAQLVSQVSGKAAFGGTPSDASIVQAIQEMRTRGKKITFYPFLMMDIPAGNALPNPYSNGAAGVGQSVYPWRGRITVSPAAGYTGTVDKTATAATQVAAFFGAATAAQFTTVGTVVSYTGPGTEWGYRRMVLHYAKLCAAAGGVDAFLIGAELRGLTTARSAAGTYPTVAALITLAGDVRAILGAGCKISYAADWTEYFGHQPGDGTNDVYFHLDPFWADANTDFIGIDNYVPLSDWRDGTAHIDAGVAATIYAPAYLKGNIAAGEGYDWFYASDAARAAQTRTLITDGLGKPWVFRYKDFRNWWINQHFNRPGGTQSGSPTAWTPQSKPIRFTELGCPAVDRGANQPNVFYDPKSAESAVPYFSRGYRDDAMQRAYIEAQLAYWGTPANNPTSTVYFASMVSVPDIAIWTWDARPYPFFPQLTAVWSDAANWTLGHWLTGRLGAASVGSLVQTLCLRAGFNPAYLDTSALTGSVEGYVIAALEAPRNSIAVLARHFGFDAVEAEGILRFVPRGAGPTVTLVPDQLVVADGEAPEPFELTRQQTTEIPLALKWSVVRSDEDYDSVMVEARRVTSDTARTVSESFPLAVPPEEAERRCRRALFEAWVGMEGFAAVLPLSLLRLDPTDVIALNHDGRLYEFRLGQIADDGARRIEGVRQDRFAYDLPPGAVRPATLLAPTTFGPPISYLMNLPQLSDATPAYQAYIGGDATPWPGSLAVFKSATTSGYALVEALNRRAITGVLAFDFYSGPTGRFDLGNQAYIDIASGALFSVSDDLLLAGNNAFAVESSTGHWEIFQAGVVQLVSPGRYKLTRLLRGQRGTEFEMANPALAGARVIFLDSAVFPLQTADADVGLTFNWLTGPASRAISDPSYKADVFTPSGAGLRPFTVEMYLEPFRRSRATGDYLIEWVRRDRAIIADSWDTGEPPLSETTEAYDIEILSGVTVLRTLTSGVASVLYTAAMQTADLGALLTVGSVLKVSIYQKSARLGRGPAFTKTLQF